MSQKGGAITKCPKPFLFNFKKWAWGTPILRLSHLYLWNSLRVLLVEYLWCNCFSVWRSLFFCGVLLATWLLHLSYYMCLWPVQSIHGKDKLIEKIVSPVWFLLVTTCDTISAISLCLDYVLIETKVALFMWSPETN